MDYFDIIFDENRHGLNHIAEKILLYLDYFSIIQFKRSCKLIYKFLKSSKCEQTVTRWKLSHDWAYRSPKVLKLSPHPISQNILRHKINCLMLHQDKTIIICSESSALRVNLAGLADLSTQSTSSNVQVFTNPNLNRETNILTCLDILSDKYLITGSRNGMLSVFNLRSAELESYKQLFGIISQIRCRGDLIATSHLGKQFDIGCISIRKFHNPNEMEVIWSVYEDVMPVFNMDFNMKFVLGLEWIETKDQAHIGILSVYKSVDEEEGCCDGARRRWNRLELDLNHCFTTSCLFRDHYCALGSAGVEESRDNWDYSLIIVDLQILTVIQVIKGHKSPVFHILPSGDRIFTRDKNGLVYLWDQDMLSSKTYRDEEYCGALVRKLSEDNETVECMTADLRKLVFVTKDMKRSVKIKDFWSSNSNNVDAFTEITLD